MAKQKPKPTEPRSEPGFEQGLARLEQIVHELEEGDVGLAESLARYEEGVRLLRRCHDLLERAERRIELLSGVDEQGNPTTEPFDAAATHQPEENPASRGGKPRALRDRAADETGKSGDEQSDVDSIGGLF